MWRSGSADRGGQQGEGGRAPLGGLSSNVQSAQPGVLHKGGNKVIKVGAVRRESSKDADGIETKPAFLC